MYNQLNNEAKKNVKNISLENVDSKQNNAINSERPTFNEKLNNDESIDKNKRKQSDMIIKKGKLLNLGSGDNSKSASPIKPQEQDHKEDPQSLWNVSFSKNKKELFNGENGSNLNYKSKLKQNSKEGKEESEEYTNFLKYKELNSSELEKQNQSANSAASNQKNEKYREGSNKRYKTPTHFDNDQKDLKIILSHDNLKYQDRQNSRNEFVIYNTNSGGSNNPQKEELIKDLLNQVKVKDYIQMNRGGDLSIPASSIPNKKTFDKLSSEIQNEKAPNELNDFNFYTPSSVNNMIKNSSQNKMYIVNNHPLSGSAGYPRGLENDPAFWFRKSKSRIDDLNEPGYSSRINSCGYNRRSNVNKSSSFRNLKYSHRSDSNSRKNKYPSNDPKNSSKRNQNTKSALSSYMAYKQGMSKSKKQKKKQKKAPTQGNMNFFTNKKNSVDSVGNSINGPYLSPFFSSRDGRPSTIMKNHEGVGNMQIDLNSAASLLQYNMVTVDSMKSKKIKKVIPLKERITQKQPKKKNQSRGARNDSTSAGNRISDAYVQERASLNQLKNLNSNNSFDPESYFQHELVQKSKHNGQYLTEGIPSVNESHNKDSGKSRNVKQTQHK